MYFLLQIKIQLLYLTNKYKIDMQLHGVTNLLDLMKPCIKLYIPFLSSQSELFYYLLTSILSNSYFVIFIPKYSGIILYALRFLLFQKLFQHNVLLPTHCLKSRVNIILSIYRYNR